MTTRTYGSVALTPVGSNANRTHAEIDISTTLTESTLLHWALAAGGCGSSALPLAGIDQFPSIDVTSRGQGKLSVDLPLTMPTTGTYHVDVFWGGGQDRSDVMACANLKPSTR